MRNQQRNPRNLKNNRNDNGGWHTLKEVETSWVAYPFGFGS